MTDPLKKSLLKMTVRQRAKALSALEQPGVEKTFVPMLSADRALWNKAKRKRGRPRVGLGAEKIRVTIERGLLERADAAAEAMHLSRAALIAMGLERILAEQTDFSRTNFRNAVDE